MALLKICFKPYRYRETSSGFIMGEEDEDDKEDIYDTLIYDCGSYYDKDIPDFIQRIWLEIVGYTLDKGPIHIGYITGYFINSDFINFMYEDYENPEYSGFNNSEVAIAFDDVSHMTLRLWEHIHNKSFKSDYYYLNSITLNKEYRTPEIEKHCIEHLQTALYELFAFDVGTIFYSVNATDISDNVTQKLSELEDIRSRNNFKNMGFKPIYIEESDRILKSDVEIWAKEL